MKHSAAAAAGEHSPNLQGPATGGPPHLEQIEAQLVKLKDELSRSHHLAMLGTLTAGIAHEINNILTPVLAYAQLARANPDDEALAQKALDRAISGVMSASRITEAVLGFARHGEQSERAHVAEVVEASLATIGRDPARDGIDLLVRVPASLEVEITPLALQQVIMNLLINAMRAMAQRGGKITIEASEEAEGHAAIVISDTGPGIPERLLGRLFDPFVSGSPQEGKSNGTDFIGGSGLGLAVCKRLVENAGGTIDVNSTEGHGASFTIVLPSVA
jgi:signal transduction histidine kinase